MSALTTEQLDQYRRQLDARATELSGEVQEAREADERDVEAATGVPGDEADTAQFKRIGDMRRAESERDELELREIADARARMADGSYGDCIDCDQPIPPERLSVQPWAARCVMCQERYERAHPNPVPRSPTGLDQEAAPR